MGEEIGEEVVPATPVDTGFARANWLPGLNAPPVVTVTRNDKTGRGAISRIAVVSRQFKAGDTLYITNNAPYIGALDAGSSPQAKKGFVKAAVARAKRTVFSRSKL